MEKAPFLAFSTPEAEGISSAWITRFLDRMQQDQLCMHSVILARHGKVIYEGYYAPMDAEIRHRMYSVSKSFVSIAIGMLEGEGKLSLNDRIAEYFPEKCPPDLHPLIAQTTIRDLLMMATPFSYNNYSETDPDWVATFFRTRPDYPSGQVYCYNTCATVVLNALVEKLTGQTFLEYMRPGLLDKIGFSKDAWCVERPEGGSWGGSGVMCTARDLARFGQVLMDGGRYNGEQLIPADYVKAATSRQIDNRIAENHSEHQFGYGYQIWQTRHGFGLFGMGSQFCLCCPETGLMLVTTGDTQAVGNGACQVLSSFWREIVERVGEPFAADEAAYQALRERPLELLPLEGAADTAYIQEIDGARYNMAPNRMQITNMQFDFSGDMPIWRYSNRTGEHELAFQPGELVETIFPETHYFGKRIGQPKGTGYRTFVRSAWVDPQVLVMYIYLADDYFGTLRAVFSFKDDSVAVLMSKVAEWFLDEYVGPAYGRK